LKVHFIKLRQFMAAVAVIVVAQVGAGRSSRAAAAAQLPVAQRGTVLDPALRAEIEKSSTSADLEQLLARRPEQAQTIVPRIEALAAAEIRRDGPGTRFVIAEIQPDEGAAGSVTIDGSAASGITLRQEFPGDVTSAAFTDGSVHRFTGTIPFATLLTLYGDGDKNHRLTFAIIAEYGMVYLRGSGRVVINDNGAPRTITFGSSR